MPVFYSRRRIFQAAAASTALRMAAQSSPEKKMRLGIIIGIGKNPEAAIKRVHDLGFPTCQLTVGGASNSAVGPLRDALTRYGVEVTSAVATGPPPEVYDLYQGPMTIGFAPRQYREAR